MLNYQLRPWEHTYNCLRPHQSLAYLTPLEFLRRWKQNHGKAKCHYLLDEYSHFLTHPPSAIMAVLKK